MNTNQRVAVIADSQNLYHTAQTKYSQNVDYEGLLDTVVDGRQLTRAIAYVIETNNNEEQSFFDAIEDIGFETKSKQIKEFKDGKKKADWDVGMCLKAVSLADHVDVIVLCTGDGDFSRLCEYLKHEGVKTEIASFKFATSNELIEKSEKFTDLSNYPQKHLL